MTLRDKIGRKLASRLLRLHWSIGCNSPFENWSRLVCLFWPWSWRPVGTLRNNLKTVPGRLARFWQWKIVYPILRDAKRS